MKRRGQSPTPSGLRPSPPDRGSRPPPYIACIFVAPDDLGRRRGRARRGRRAPRKKASPPRGKLSAVRLTDEGDHGGHGWFFPSPPHPSFASQMPPSPLWGEGKGPPRAAAPTGDRQGQGGHTGPPLHGGGQSPPHPALRATFPPGGRYGGRPHGAAPTAAHRFVFCHCEEGRRPDAAIRLSVQRETDSHGPSGASE